MPTRYNSIMNRDLMTGNSSSEDAYNKKEGVLLTLTWLHLTDERLNMLFTHNALMEKI